MRLKGLKDDFHRNFFWKILFLAKVIALSNLKNTYNHIVRANLNRDSLKISFKISSYIFWDKPLKLYSYFLGTKTKFLSGQIFDLGLRSDNIEFWKCLPSKTINRARLRFSKLNLFSLLRPKSKIWPLKSFDPLKVSGWFF